MPADRITPEIEVLRTADELAEKVADEISLAADGAVANRGRFSLALAGGSTPLLLYELLGGRMRDAIPWESTLLFWGDERLVPHDHPESNFRSVRHALLDQISVPHDQVFPIPTDEQNAQAAARKYERTLRRYLPQEPSEPSFDVVLLGLGDDGHTASLFPGTPAAEITAPETWTAPGEAPPDAAVRERVTLTLPLINRARQVFFLVSGEGKREALRRILLERADVPAAKVSARLRLVWFIDEPAQP